MVRQVLAASLVGFLSDQGIWARITFRDARGKIDVEMDGDSWHANKEKAAEDNVRDNALVAKGWSVFRFGTAQVAEQLTEYCTPQIVAKIKSLGGIEEGGVVPRLIELRNAAGLHQKGLFDDS